jgi:hypothetical protein
LGQRHRLGEPVGLPICGVVPLRPGSCRFHHGFGLGAGFGNATDPADLRFIEAPHVCFALDPTIGHEEVRITVGRAQLLV